MYGKFEQHLESELQAIRDAGFYKTERVITTPQGSHVEIDSGGDLDQPVRQQLSRPRPE